MVSAVNGIVIEFVSKYILVPKIIRSSEPVVFQSFYLFMRLLIHLCFLAMILVPTLGKTQVDPPYDDWLENKIYLKVDSSDILMAGYAYQVGLRFGEVRLNQSNVGFISIMQTGTIAFPANKLTKLESDTCEFINSYSWDIYFLVIRDADTMKVTFRNVGFTSYYLHLPFHSGEYEFTPLPSNEECDQTFATKFYHPDRAGGVTIIDLPEGKSPSVIKASYLKPCFEGIYELTAPVKAWNITPEDWSLLKL